MGMKKVRMKAGVAEMVKCSVQDDPVPGLHHRLHQRGTPTGSSRRLTQPPNGFGKFLLVLLALSIIANNVLHGTLRARPSLCLARCGRSSCSSRIPFAGREHFLSIISNFLSIPWILDGVRRVLSSKGRKGYSAGMIWMCRMTSGSCLSGSQVSLRGAMVSLAQSSGLHGYVQKNDLYDHGN